MMPGMVVDVSNGDNIVNKVNGNDVPYKGIFPQKTPPRTPLSSQSPQSFSIDLAIDRVVDTSIEQLYNNVWEMESSDHSPSRASFLSYGEESRIDSELGHLVGANYGEELMKEMVMDIKEEGKKGKFSGKNIDTSQKMTKKHDKIQSSKKISPLNLKFNAFSKSSPQTQSSHDKKLKKFSAKKQKSFLLGGTKFKNGTKGPPETGLDNPDLGPFLLKQSRDLISSGGKPRKALELALRARESFEKCADEKTNLELVMCLHLVAAMYSNLGQYNDAIPILERSIEIPIMENGQNHALAKFAGCMQLGDTYAMLGQIENSILFYTAGLEIQKQVLDKNDPRVGETCRYVSEAYAQTLQFDEAEKLCQMALQIHRENVSPASLEEAADRELMGLICHLKGDHEEALEHYVLASMAMAADGHEINVAFIDCSIGDAYLSLSRFDEAVFAYHKALSTFKLIKGENHTTVASIYVRLADLNKKNGKFSESKSYCGNALRIYAKPIPGIPSEEIASGLSEVSAIFESMNDLERALKLLQKALNIYRDMPGQQSTVAGIEAQMGVLYYMTGSYGASYNSFKNAVSMLRAIGEKKTALFGIVLNQMGLACVQRFAINEAAELFEEARNVFEKEYGPYHPDTLGVYSNLAGTYDALGRLEDAIEILEFVVGMREEKLGTANPDVTDERRRLEVLLKEAGRVRSRKSMPLESLIDGIKVL